MKEIYKFSDIHKSSFIRYKILFSLNLKTIEELKNMILGFIKKIN